MSIDRQLQIGPFKAIYHQQRPVEAMRIALIQFMDDRLLPQVDHPVSTITGALEAEKDEDRFCGSNSAVLDLYRLKAQFLHDEMQSHAQVLLVYEANAFRRAKQTGNTCYVSTPSRRAVVEREQRQINAIAKEIWNGDERPKECPICRTQLQVVNNDLHFYVSCPNRCFRRCLTKDGHGSFISGHFFMYKPVCEFDT